MHALALSPLIIQDHLKSIFAKSGARSRNELVSQIFLEHYAPRWEDIPDVPVGWIAKASPIGTGGDPRPSLDAAILAGPTFLGHSALLRRPQSWQAAILINNGHVRDEEVAGSILSL
jgi:hypothetical protein